MLLPLQDSHAKAASRRPQSGLKGTARLQSATTKCVFRLQLPTRKRPRGGVKMASKELRDPKAQPQAPALVFCFPLRPLFLLSHLKTRKKHTHTGNVQKTHSSKRHPHIASATCRLTMSPPLWHTGTRYNVTFSPGPPRHVLLIRF